MTNSEKRKLSSMYSGLGLQLHGTTAFEAGKTHHEESQYFDKNFFENVKKFAHKATLHIRSVFV